MSSTHQKPESLLQKDLPDYQIKKVLGSGSTATVYLANQISLNREVAIKRFSPESYGENVDLSARFNREAAIWAHLSHENLVHLYDYIKTKKAQYIVLEYCHGLDLRELMDKSVRIPLDISVCIIYQIACALEYLHNYNIIHRDIKPANIFVRSDGNIKLMDFGVSFCAELESFTIPGSIMGTPAYMSPEQALGKENIDARVDIYSLGVVWFELLEGFKPFKSGTLEKLLKEVAQGQHIKLSRRFSWSQRNLIHQCMKKDPNQRPDSAKKIRHWCERYFKKNNISNAKIHLQNYLLKEGHVKEVKKLFPNELIKELSSPEKSLHLYKTKIINYDSPKKSFFTLLFVAFLCIGSAIAYMWFFQYETLIVFKDKQLLPNLLKFQEWLRSLNFKRS